MSKKQISVWVQDLSDGQILARDSDYKHGILDRDGNIVVPLIYESIKDLPDGLLIIGEEVDREIGEAAYEDDDEYCYDDEEYDYYNDLYEVSKSRVTKYGIMDRSGNIIVPLIYLDIRIQSNGLFRALDSFAKCGILDRNGNIIAPFIYDEIEDFNEGVAVIRCNDLYGAINESGEEVVPPKFLVRLRYKDGITMIHNDRGLWGYMDKEGVMVIPTIFDGLSEFKDGKILVEKNLRALYIDRDLNYYTMDNEPILCKKCPCYNDKIITGFCCRFFKD